MLVLTRKVGQHLTIGTATVIVLSLQGGRVKLGIYAPPDIAILRPELLSISASASENENETAQPQPHVHANPTPPSTRRDSLLP